jgi:hypothetical protein
MRLWHVHYYTPHVWGRYWIVSAKTAHQARLKLWRSLSMIRVPTLLAVQEVVG